MRARLRRVPQPRRAAAAAPPAQSRAARPPVAARCAGPVDRRSPHDSAVARRDAAAAPRRDATRRFAGPCCPTPCGSRSSSTARCLSRRAARRPAARLRRSARRRADAGARRTPASVDADVVRQVRVGRHPDPTRAWCSISTASTSYSVFRSTARSAWSSTACAPIDAPTRRSASGGRRPMPSTRSRGCRCRARAAPPAARRVPAIATCAACAASAVPEPSSAVRQSRRRRAGAGHARSRPRRRPPRRRRRQPRTPPAGSRSPVSSGSASRGSSSTRATAATIPGAHGTGITEAAAGARRRAAPREAAAEGAGRRGGADAPHRRVHPAPGAHRDRQPRGRRSVPLDPRQRQPQRRRRAASRPTS